MFVNLCVTNTGTRAWDWLERRLLKSDCQIFDVHQDLEAYAVDIFCFCFIILGIGTNTYCTPADRKDVLLGQHQKQLLPEGKF